MVGVVDVGSGASPSVFLSLFAASISAGSILTTVERERIGDWYEGGRPYVSFAEGKERGCTRSFPGVEKGKAQAIPN